MFFGPLHPTCVFTTHLLFCTVSERLIQKIDKWINAFHGCLFSYAWAIKLKMCDPNSVFKPEGNHQACHRGSKRLPLGSPGRPHSENDVHVSGGKDHAKSAHMTRASVFRYLHYVVNSDTSYSGRMIIAIFQFAKEIHLATHSSPELSSSNLFLSAASSEQEM